MAWGNRLLKEYFDRDTKEVFKGGIIAMAYRMISFAAGYLIIYLISKQFGAKGMGIYELAVAIAAVLALLGSFGFRTSILRFVSQYRAENNYYFINRFCSMVYSISGVLSITIAILLYFLSDWVSNNIFNEPLLSLPLKYVAFALPLISLNAINVEIIRALKLIQVSELFRRLSIQIGLVLLLWFTTFNFDHFDIPVKYYAISASISGALTFIISLNILRIFYKRGKRSDVSNRLFSVKFHLKTTFPMVVTAFILLINSHIDSLMLGNMNDTRIVGIYGVAVKLALLTNFILLALGAIAAPKISELYWKKDRLALKMILSRTSALIFSFALPVSLILVLFGEHLLRFIGEEFVEGIIPLILLAIAQFINSYMGLVGMFLDMTGKQIFYRNLMIIALLMNAGLNYLLIPKMGMVGAAIGTLVATVFWNFVGAYKIWKSEGMRTFYLPLVKQKNDS